MIHAWDNHLSRCLLQLGEGGVSWGSENMIGGGGCRGGGGGGLLPHLERDPAWSPWLPLGLFLWSRRQQTCHSCGRGTAKTHLWNTASQTGECSEYTGIPSSHAGGDTTGEHSEHTGTPSSYAGGDTTGEHREYTGTPSSHAGRDKTGELSEDTGTPLTHAGGKTGEHSKYKSI